MKIAFPVEKNEGLESIVYGHFGSAPMLVAVDGTTGIVTTIASADEGGLRPLKALEENPVSAVVVAGIGGGALGNLASLGIEVYRAVEPTIEDNLLLLKSGQLPRWDVTGNCGCSGHGHEHHHGGSHHHHHHGHHHGGGCGCKH